MQFRILLADDHIITMDGLSTAIAGIVPGAIIDLVCDLDAALRCLKEKRPHLVICDVNMPGGNHFGMVEKIRAVHGSVKILILSAYSARLYGRRYLQAGADAYLCKNVDSSEIQRTVLELLQGNDTRIPSTAVDVKSEGLLPLAVLSDRELEIAQMLIDGQGMLEIAAILKLQPSTVSTYKNRIFGKLDILSIPELVTVFHNSAE